MRPLIGELPSCAALREALKGRRRSPALLDKHAEGIDRLSDIADTTAVVASLRLILLIGFPRVDHACGEKPLGGGGEPPFAAIRSSSDRPPPQALPGARLSIGGFYGYRRLRRRR